MIKSKSEEKYCIVLNSVFSAYYTSDSSIKHELIILLKAKTDINHVFLIVLCVLLCFIYTVCMTNFVSKICENNSPDTSQPHILDAVVDK